MANQGLSNGKHKLASSPGLASFKGLGNSIGFGSLVLVPAEKSVTMKTEPKGAHDAPRRKQWNI
jgi:hypothetical protein